MGRILVVDDTLFMRTLLKNILFSGGHTIVGECLDTVGRRPHDLDVRRFAEEIFQYCANKY